MFANKMKVMIAMMGSSIVILLMSLYYGFYAHADINQYFDPHTLVHQERTTQSLNAMLAELNLVHDGTLTSVVPLTQQELLRPKGLERWQAPQIFEHKKEALMPLLKQLGFITAVYPRFSSYEFGLLFGALAQSICKRLAFMLMLLQQGYTIKTIVYLVGERPLDAERESVERMRYHIEQYLKPWLVEHPAYENLASLKTEADVMRWLLENIPLASTHSHMLIVAPMKVNEKGEKVRPSTADTLQAWIAAADTKGTCLGISSQPYILYQYWVAREWLPNTVLDMCGPAFDEKHITSALDSVARALYQIQRCTVQTAAA